jgi:hypothetical protein
MEAVTARAAYLEPWGNGKEAWEVALGCSGSKSLGVLGLMCGISAQVKKKKESFGTIN